MKQAKKLQKNQKEFDILISEKETDPGTLLCFQLIMIMHESSSK
jgi:hypothetical protein